MRTRANRKPKLTSQIVPTLRAVLAHHDLSSAQGQSVAKLAQLGFVTRIGEIRGRHIWAATPAGVTALAAWDGGYTEIDHVGRHGKHVGRAR